MFDVKLKAEPARAYESVSKEVASADVDAFVRETVARLRERYEPDGVPFGIYKGCDKEDAQLVEICLPTRDGRNLLPAGEVAYTVARGEQCDYPAILSAYDAVVRFVEDSGRALAGPPRETYLGEAEMEIAFPVMP